jgi:hypothetical protein
VIPRADAVATATPSETPVTRPVSSSMLAMEGAELDHSTATCTVSPRPLSTVALSWMVAPMSTVAGEGVTMTVATASIGSGPVPSPRPSPQEPTASAG